MKTAPISKINVQKVKAKINRFNFNRSVDTTMPFGRLQVLDSHEMLPNSSAKVKYSSFIRSVPLAVPTLGSVSLETDSTFVPYDKVFPFKEYLARSGLHTTSLNTKTVIRSIPNMTLGQLSLPCLRGARVEVYDGLFVSGVLQKALRCNVATNDYTDATTSDSRQSSLGDVITTSSTALAPLKEVLTSPFFYGNDYSLFCEDAGTWWSSALDTRTSAPCFRASVVTDRNSMTSVQASADHIALANDMNFTDVSGIESTSDIMPSMLGLFHWTDTNTSTGVSTLKNGVDMEAADFIIIDRTTMNTYSGMAPIVAVQMSPEGRAWANLMRGLGYQPNFACTENVNILPILAAYRSWFETYGIEGEMVWDDTDCANLVRYFTRDGNVCGTTYNGQLLKGGQTDSSPYYYFVKMAKTLSDIWYTEVPDAISCWRSVSGSDPNAFQNVAFPSVSDWGVGEQDPVNWQNNVDNFSSGVNTILNGSTGKMASYNQLAGQSAGTQKALDTDSTAKVTVPALSSVLDIEVAKIMLHRAVRGSLLQKNICKRLKLEGLGNYYEDLGTHYLGHGSTQINISEVVSQAATDNAALGEDGGRGTGYRENKPIKFKAPTFGMYITWGAVIPHGGLSQTIEHSRFNIDSGHWFRPDFDALGYEALRTLSVKGDSQGNMASHDLKTAFGVAPRYTHLKFKHNLSNGGFANFSQKSYFNQYSLDRDIDGGNIVVDSDNIDVTSGMESIVCGFISPTEIPTGGSSWRYPVRYQNIGNFDRIFNAGIAQKWSPYTQWMNDSTEVTGAYGTDMDEAFIIHMLCDVDYYAPLKPFEFSFDQFAKHGEQVEMNN